MSNQSFRYQWGPSAIWDYLVTKSMLKRAGDINEKTLLPVACLIHDADDILERFASIQAANAIVNWYDSPRVKWEKLYANFVRELEFLLKELKPHLSPEDFDRLVVQTVADRLDGWIGFFKPMMWMVNGKIPKWVTGGNGKTMHDLFVGPLKAPLSKMVSNMSAFLVGPIEPSLAEDGALEMYIPDCAMHRLVSDEEAQENSCLYACKGACERLFGEGDPMTFVFEPNLPEFDCTLKVYFAGNENTPNQIQTEASSTQRIQLVNQ